MQACRGCELDDGTEVEKKAKAKKSQKEAERQAYSISPQIPDAIYFFSTVPGERI